LYQRIELRQAPKANSTKTKFLKRF